MKIFKHRK